MANTVPWKTTSSGIEVPDGVYDASDLIRIPYVVSEMPYLNKGGSLFWKVLQMIPMGESVDQPRFEFFTDTKFETHVVTDGAELVGATTIDITEDIAIPNQTLYNVRTGEVVYVVSKSTTTLTIERGWGGTTAAAVNDEDVWIVLVTNLPEGASYNDGIVKLPVKDYNYISFFSESVSETDLQKMANMRDSIGKVEHSYTDHYLKLVEQQDNQLRFGVRAIDDRSEGRVYSMGGFKDLCGNNIDITYGATYQDVNDLLNDTFNHTASSPTKIMMVGQTGYDILIGLQHARQPVSPPVWNPEIGAYITRIVLSGGGVIDIMLDKFGMKPSRGLSDWYFMIDPANIKRRAYNGFEDIVRRDVTEPGSHTYTDEMYGCIGMEMKFGDYVHAYGKFLTS